MNATPEWMADAACRGATSVFFVEGRGGDIPAQVAEAKQICATCPVVDECLRHAVATHERFGVWGGKTTNERRNWARTNQVRLRICVECGTRYTPPEQTGTPTTTCGPLCAAQRRARQQDDSRRRRAS